MRYHAGVTVGFTPSRHRWIGIVIEVETTTDALARRSAFPHLAEPATSYPAQSEADVDRPEATVRRACMLAESAMLAGPCAIHPAPENPIRPIR